jgi:hypothetical protein
MRKSLFAAKAWEFPLFAGKKRVQEIGIRSKKHVSREFHFFAAKKRASAGQ